MSEENSSPESAEAQTEEAPAEESQEYGEAAPEGQLQDVVETALANGASEKEVKSLIREYQLKVNGKTINKKIDLSDENGLRNELQLAAAARQMTHARLIRSFQLFDEAVVHPNDHEHHCDAVRWKGLLFQCATSRVNQRC